MENSFTCVTLAASFKSELAFSVPIPPDKAIWPGEEEAVLLTVTKLDGC
jgi:hypothetical protein